MDSAALFALLASLLLAGLVVCQMYLVYNVYNVENNRLDLARAPGDLNKFVNPDILAHTCLAFLFLIIGRKWSFLLHLPLLLYHGYRAVNKTHKFRIMDLTRFLNRRKWETVLKLLFYFISFLYYFDEFYYVSYRAYLHRMVVAMREENLRAMSTSR